MHVTFNAHARRRAYQGNTIEFRGFLDAGFGDGFLTFEFPERRNEGFNLSTIDAYIYTEEE
jgi:hypothetical protein